MSRRSVRDVLRVILVKYKEEKERKWIGRADPAVGLTPMKGEGEGKMIRQEETQLWVKL